MKEPHFVDFIDEQFEFCSRHEFCSMLQYCFSVPFTFKNETEIKSLSSNNAVTWPEVASPTKFKSESECFCQTCKLYFTAHDSTIK